MIKRLVKLVLKYPIILANKIYIWTYFKRNKPNNEYLEISPKGNEKILVLSPHVDDETIGLGGSINKYAKAGSKMSLVYLTDGSGSTSHKSKEETIKERMEEGMEVKKAYGFESIYFLDGIDGFLDSQEDSLVERLEDILLKEDPDIIFSPFLIDGNKDHIETTKALSKVLNTLDKEIDIYLYQVNSLISPELVNGISFMDEKSFIEKNNKYNIFKSQWAMGFSVYNLLDRGRAWSYPNNNYATEPFVMTRSTGLKEIIEKIEENDFNPSSYIQISSEFTLIKSMIKSNKEKEFYTGLVMDIILKNKKRGGSSERAI